MAFGIACQKIGRGLRRLWQCVIICGGLRADIGRERGGALAGRSGRLPYQAELADPEQSRGAKSWIWRDWLMISPLGPGIPVAPPGFRAAASIVSRPARRAMAGEPKP